MTNSVVLGCEKFPSRVLRDNRMPKVTRDLRVMPDKIFKSDINTIHDDVSIFLFLLFRTAFAALPAKLSVPVTVFARRGLFLIN